MCVHGVAPVAMQEDGVTPKADRGSIIEAAVLYIQYLKATRPSGAAPFLLDVQDDDDDSGSCVRGLLATVYPYLWLWPALPFAAAC